MNYLFDKQYWVLPFHFWSAMVFGLGCIVGSFLNVCVHRMPRGESVVSPPSHCPHCQYSIPWYLNIPLVTWLYLRGRCRSCGAPIAIRYFLVELLTGLMFLAAWVGFGRVAPGLALAYCVLLAGFMVATFIDLEHFIIPDEITLGGIGVGFLLSFLVPSLHRAGTIAQSLERSLIGAFVGFGLMGLILLLGKLLYGRERFDLGGPARVVFGEDSLKLPDRSIPYEELFYRQTDTIALEASRVEMADRCYVNVPVRLRQKRLVVGTDQFDPASISCLEAVTREIVVPREAMGLGDVKFMAAIGAFLGAQAVVFTLMLSAVIGAAVGVTLIALGRQDWSSRLPYGPYIAVAATLWIFGGHRVLEWWLAR